MTSAGSKFAIHLSDNNVVGQAGLANINVRDIHFSLVTLLIDEVPKSKSRKLHSTQRTERTSSSTFLAQGAGVARTAPDRAVARTLIFDRDHTIIAPGTDDTFRLVFEKTRTAFELRLSKYSEGEKSEKQEQTKKSVAPQLPASPGADTPKDRQESILEHSVNGYKFSFYSPAPIQLHGPPDMGREAENPPLQGIPLTICRSGFGEEHFVLTNFSFEARPKEPRPISDRSLVIEQRRAGTLVGKRTYYLDDPPVKLGDGSFGVVYQVRQDSGEHVSHSATTYAIKIFYNRQMMTRTGLIRVEPETYNALAIDKNDQIMKVDEISLLSLIELLFRSVEKIDIQEARIKLLRILEKSEEMQNVSQGRFGREKLISQQMRQVLKDLPVNPNEISCVQTEFDTNRFRRSPMFEFLVRQAKEVGGETADNYSDYAIIMELCDETLEDILERHWKVDDPSTQLESGNNGGERAIRREEGINEPDLRACATLISADGEDGEVPVFEADGLTFSGYDLLANLNFRDRLAVTHPIVERLARALQLLHATGNFHHDIKPGNVFIKNTLNDFVISLGDFSFVGSGVDEGTTEAVLKESIQTGSIHFRSPEQRNFNDAAYGIVRHGKCCDNPGQEYQNQDTNWKDVDWVYVRILDPKFRSSPIARDDVVVFPSDRKGLAYRVEHIHDGSKYRDVWLNVSQEEFASLFPEEARTKVYLYKVPTVRSDLFGLGAVFFDLVTAGKSPERFYEALRPFDVPSKEHQQMYSSEYIMQRYAMYERFAGTMTGAEIEAALLNLFDFFRNGNDVAPSLLVEILVKLMGSNFPDSYYSLGKTDSALPGFPKGANDIAASVTLALSDIGRISEGTIFDLAKQKSETGHKNLLLNPSESQDYLRHSINSAKATDSTPVQAESRRKLYRLLSLVGRVRDLLRPHG